MCGKGMGWTNILIAAALGLLVHGLIGYVAFPMGDDFAYAPLAEYRADPSLFPRDGQLQLFENHALVYEALYRLGAEGPGVEPVFRAAVWVQAALASVLLLALLSVLGVPLAGLPVVLGLGVVVAAGGLGRGEFGGLVSPFFHHHNVALTLLIAAVAASLRRRNGLAGGLLGLAAYAQPMTALHGAFAVGLGALTLRPSGVVRLALAAAVVALPVAILVVGEIVSTPPSSPAFDLVEDAYRFRAPHHYDPDLRLILVATLYLLAGWTGALLLTRANPELGRAAAGVMAAFTCLHLVTVFVYRGGLAEWVPLFILDANRSTPLLFALAPVFAIAGLWRAPWSPTSLAAALLLAGILVLNGTAGGASLVVLSGVMIALRERAWARPAVLGALGVILVLQFPPQAAPPVVPDETRVLLDRIRAETPPDALFVIPVAMFEFRHYAQRSAYVDFKLFSVAQPDQAALTRARIEEVVRPDPAHSAAAGWPGMALWEEDQRRAATCDGMSEILRATGADFYLRRVAPDETPPDCPALPLSMRSETLALYGPPG
jgi:hypothetical protein